MKNKYSLILILIITFTASSFAQVFVSDVSKKGTTAAPFLSIAQGARATSMGSAFVGISDDPSAIYWNPSGLAKLSGTQVSFDHTTWLADVEYNFVSASYSVGDYGTLGFSFTSSNIGEMRVTTIEQPGGTGETFSATDVAVSIAYALNLTDNFAIGFAPKFINQSIWKMNASAIAMDLGVQYRTPFAGTILAMSISNFGSKMQLSGNSNLIQHDLDPENGGNNAYIPAYLQTDQWSLPLTFRVGLAYTANFNENHFVNFAVDALHPSDNYESINVGAEYWLYDFIAVRGGLNSVFLDGAESSSDKYDMGTFALGIGVKKQFVGNLGLKFDYAYQDFGRLTNIQKFTVGITF